MPGPDPDPFFLKEKPLYTLGPSLYEHYLGGNFVGQTCDFRIKHENPNVKIQGTAFDSFPVLRFLILSFSRKFSTCLFVAPRKSLPCCFVLLKISFGTFCNQNKIVPDAFRFSSPEFPRGLSSEGLVAFTKRKNRQKIQKMWILDTHTCIQPTKKKHQATQIWNPVLGLCFGKQVSIVGVWFIAGEGFRENDVCTYMKENKSSC